MTTTNRSTEPHSGQPSRFRNAASQIDLLGAAAFVLGFVFYLLPLTMMGENGFVEIHDNLDSAIADRVVLAREGLLFEHNAPVMAIMNGIPRDVLPSGLSPSWWTFALLEPFTAYWIQYVVVHVVAFLGMFLLLQRHVIPQEANYLTALGVAFCFAILPHYVVFGLTVAGLPLLWFAALNLVNRRHFVMSYAIIFLYGLYSSLAVMGAFVLLGLGAVWLVYVVRDRSFHWPLVAGLGLLLVTYLVLERHMIATQFLDDSFVSHRVERWRLSIEQQVGLSGALARGLDLFVLGQRHVATVHGFIALLVAPLALLWTRSDTSRALRPIRRLLILLLGVALLISLLYGLEQWSVFLPLKDAVPFLHAYQIRFYWYFPLIWYLVLALALTLLGAGRRLIRPISNRIIVVAIIVAQAGLILANNPEITTPVKQLLGIRWVEELSYGEFYSTDLFNDIADYIDQPQETYRVISLGMHPAISLYNGFYALDGYQNNYSLEYKYQFRELIAGELDKSPQWRDYFDNWGNRAYFYSAELGNAMYTKYDNAVVYDLTFDTEAFRALGGAYLLSAVEIANHAEIGLTHVRTFVDETSPWRVFLYRA